MVWVLLVDGDPAKVGTVLLHLISEGLLRATELSGDGTVGDALWVILPKLNDGVGLRIKLAQAGKGADWLYTYLRSFYRDEKRPNGWNNTLFPNVAMPHALWELQGELVLDAETHALKLATPGQLSVAEYDKEIADLVGFLVWAGEPGAGFRKNLGIGVLVFLFVLLGVSYALKKNYWKDVEKN